MKRNLAYILGALFVMTSCVEEKVLDNIVPTPGDEVEFTAGLNTGVQTKTLYGADNGINPIKVKWVNGDKVMVYGTTCTEGSDCQVAEYQVSTSKTSTPNTDDGQNVADGLDKTGDIGVRWGSAATSDFVAVYPSENASFTYNSTSKVVTATTSIDSTQNYVFNDEPTSKTVTNSDGTTSTISVWEGTHFANDATDPSMSNAIMYARTDDVPAGDPVGLSFKPFSTVLKFRFMGFDSNLFPNTELYIQNIKITAPKGYHIAGDFDMTIPRNEDVENNPVTATSKNNSTNTNTVTINTIKSGGSYLKLAANQAVEFNVFTVPLSGLKMTSTDLWTVTIQAQGYEPWVYKMIPTATGGYTLVPGLIHKVKVPQLISKTEVEWNPENWITQIPVPVYISELSMPGTWYSCHPDYQNTTDLATQYKAGIRAFNIDCRITYETEGGEDVQVEGDNTWWDSDDDVYRAAEHYLVVAGTDRADGNSVTGVDYYRGDLVVDKIKTIAALIPENEYVVIVLTIAEKPLSRNPLLGSTIVSGNVDPAKIIPAIKDILDGKSKDSDGNTVSVKDLKLYTSPVTSMTTIDNVKGHMIVKINTNNSTISNYTYPDYALTSFASMAMSDWNTNTDNITDLASDYYTKMQTASMYWGNTAKDLTYYYHQAQRTTSGVNTYAEDGSVSGTDYSTTYQVSGVPTLQMRKDAIKNIVDQSKTIYDNGKHNGWFQLGIGGYTKDSDYSSISQSDVSTELNAYVQNLIENKMDNDPSPVGIVLMNHACDASGNGIQLVNDIIEMNGKFYLNRVGGSITTGDGTNNSGNGTTTTETKNAAYAVVGDNAF